ncbi:hypothetical protein YC2023_007673 [Brassica napus]
MEKASLLTPANPHFFQPLLTGFQSHLNIPVTFFSKHIEGKHEGKTVELRSDSSDRTWKVKMEGHRLTDGWKEFAKAHDLRIYDVVIFRQEGDMLFHVTAFGTSCCEIQYAPSGIHVKVKEESEEIGESSRREKESSSKPTCFSQYVTASNLSRGAVGVPLDFARRNGLNKGRRVIALRNQEGKSWESKLKSTSLSKVKRKKETLSESEEDNVVDKTETPRFVKITTTASSLEIGKQNIPVHFTRANKLNKPGKIVLVDKDKVEWSMKLNQDSRSGTMYIMGESSSIQGFESESIVSTLSTSVQHSEVTTDGEEDDEVDDEEREGTGIEFCPDRSMKKIVWSLDSMQPDLISQSKYCEDSSVKLPLPTQELQRLAVNLQEQVVVDGECITLFSGEPAFLPASSYRFPKPSQGKHEGKTVKLRSDSSDRTWKVKMEGHRLTEGWKEFAKAHDLRVGDVVIFRQEGDMLFHVTAFGTSCCELQYVLSGRHDVKEEGDVIGESSRREKESSPSLTCFNQTVTAGSLSNGLVGVPLDFATKGGIRLEVGDSLQFKLLQNTETPVFQLSSHLKVKREKGTLPEEEEEEDNVVDKTKKPRFVTITPSASNLEIVSTGTFHESEQAQQAGEDSIANKVVAGESLTLELIRRGRIPLLKFFSKVKYGATTVQNKDSRTQENSSSETEPVEKIEA